MPKKIKTSVALARVAFTLIELLVVIAIIAVLASMLLPALSRAKEMAKRMRCTSNIHEIALANYMYADDNQSTYPPRSGVERWTTFFLDYYNNPAILICPSERTNTPYTYGNNPQYPYDEVPRTYFINGFNDGLQQKYGVWPIPSSIPWPVMGENDVRLPSDTVIFGEKLANVGDFYMDYFDIDDGLRLDQAKHSSSLVNTNFGGSMYAFVDGSTRFLTVNKSLSPVVLWCTTSWRTNTAAPP